MHHMYTVVGRREGDTVWERWMVWPTGKYTVRGYILLAGHVQMCL